MRPETDELSMLLVAEGERLAPALRERLLKQGVHVRDCEPADVADTAFVVAPDIVVLCGTATADGGLEVLESLAARPATAGLPVVLVGDPGLLGAQVSSFRHGVVAIADRTASADELASEIVDVARELPERAGEASGDVDAAGVETLVELLAESLRTGIVTLSGPGGVSARVVVRADRPARQVLSEVIERLRPLASAQGGLQYEFHESPTGRLGALDVGRVDDVAALTELGRSRLLLIEHNRARAALLAAGLGALGARVAVADSLEAGLGLAREHTPDVIIVDAAELDGWALDALRKIRRDPWLRWAAVLLTDSRQLWRDEQRPDVAAVAASVEALMRPDHDLARAVETESVVVTRLDVLGPVRTLRALAETKLGLRLWVLHARIGVDIELSDGIIASASARAPNDAEPAAEGPVALATFLGLSRARLKVERAEAPRAKTLMLPVDDAVAVSQSEEPVVARSQPPPSLASAAPRTSPNAADVARLVAHLEQVLGDVREHAEQGLRRRMRESSQRLRAAAPRPLGTPAAPALAARVAPDAPAHRGPSRKHTLIGIPIDNRALSPPSAKVQPALPTAPAPQPATPAAKVPQPAGTEGTRSLRMPAPARPAPRPPLAKTPAPLQGKAAAPRAAATPPPETASAVVAPASEHVAPPPSAEIAPVEIAAATQDEAALDKTATEIDTRAVPDPEADALDVLEIDANDFDIGPTVISPPPSHAPAAGPDEASAQPVAASAPSPFDAPPAASAPSPFDAPPAVFDDDVSGLPGARSKKWLVLGAVAAGLVLIVGLVFIVRAVISNRAPTVATAGPGTTPTAPTRPGTTPTAPTAPDTTATAPAPPDTTATAPTAPDTTATAPTAPDTTPTAPTAPDTTPTAPTAPAAPARTVPGPLPGEPLEGSDADVDLARLGVVATAGPSNRRVRARLFARLLRSANQARRRNRFAESERIYKRVLAMDPSSGRATAGLSLVYLDREQAEPAISWAQRLLRLRAVSASHWVLLGDALRLGNNLDAARRAYSRALEVDARNRTARERLRSLPPP